LLSVPERRTNRVSSCTDESEGQDGSDLPQGGHRLDQPIILGGGKRIFTDDGEARPLELVSTTPTGTGVLICVYRPTGEAARTGSSDALYE
jgi:hypothetical protein